MADAKNFFFSPVSSSPITSVALELLQKLGYHHQAVLACSLSSSCADRQPGHSLDGKTGLVIWGEDAGQIIVPTFTSLALNVKWC